MLYCYYREIQHLNCQNNVKILSGHHQEKNFDMYMHLLALVFDGGAPQMSTKNAKINRCL